MKLDAKQFLDAALPALKFADPNPVSFITGAVLIAPIEGDATKVSVTAATAAGSLTCIAPVTTAPVSKFCIMGADLLKAIKTFYGDSTITVKKNMATLTCGKSKFEIPIEDPKTFPKTENFGDELGLVIKTSDLKNVLSFVGSLSEDYDMNPQMSGVMFTGNTAVAVKPKDFGSGAAIAVNGIEKDFCIPHRAIPHIMNAIECTGEDEEVTIAVNDDRYLTLSIQDCTINVIPNSGIPPFNQFRDRLLGQFKSTPASKFDIDADVFKSALVRASLFNPQYIKIDFTDSEVIVDSHSVLVDDPAFNKQASASCPLLRKNFRPDAELQKDRPPYYFNSARFTQGISKMSGEITVLIIGSGYVAATSMKDKTMFFCCPVTFSEK